MQLKRGQTFMLSGCKRVWMTIIVAGGHKPKAIMCHWRDDGTSFRVDVQHELTHYDVDMLLSGSTWKLI